jgi:hypothetical protein
LLQTRARGLPQRLILPAHVERFRTQPPSTTDARATVRSENCDIGGCRDDDRRNPEQLSATHRTRAYFRPMTSAVGRRTAGATSISESRMRIMPWRLTCAAGYSLRPRAARRAPSARAECHALELRRRTCGGVASVHRHSRALFARSRECEMLESPFAAGEPQAIYPI